MATSLLSSAAVRHHNRNSSIIVATSRHLPSINFFSSCNPSTGKIVSTYRPSLLPPRNCSSRRGRCCAASPHPPDSGPPPGDENDSNSGSIASFSRLQEKVQIYFAVLFWMSLFFWSSVWDGRNNGRSDKGPRFRK